MVGGALHALINNAGNMYRGAITDLDEKALLDVFNTNVVAGNAAVGFGSTVLRGYRRRYYFYWFRSYPSSISRCVPLRGNQSCGGVTDAGFGGGAG